MAGFDVFAAGRTVVFPTVLAVQQLCQRVGAGVGVVGCEKRSGHAVFDQLAMSPDIGGGDQLALGHCLERF